MSGFWRWEWRLLAEISMMVPVATCPMSHAVPATGQSRAPATAESALRDRPTGTVSLAISVSHADVSFVDHKPEELANLTLTELRLEWASGIGPEGTFASFRLSVQNLQLDDQLPYSRCCTHTVLRVLVL